MSHNSKGLKAIITKEYLIKEHYENKKTIRQIARDNNCSHSNIRKYFKKFGLTSQTTLKGNEYGRIYEVNHNYFESIDSKEKAYWFGFLYADGYIRENNQNKPASLRFSLAGKDKNMVYQLRDKLGNMSVSKYIQKETGHTAYYFDVNSAKLTEDLYNKNMTSPKNERIGLPIIEDKYFYPFLLGLFDGDGSIVVSNNVPSVSFLGSKEEVEWIKEKLLSDGFVFNNTNIYKLSGIYRLSFSSQRNIPLIYNKFYVNNKNVPYMKRKKEIFDNYLSEMKI